MSHIFDILNERGYIEQITHENELRELLSKGSVPFYIGFDPTADSLHIGHFVSSMVMSHMQKAGHKPIILIGGGTVCIGDPSGKTDMRQVMTREIIDSNVEKFKEQLSRFVSFEGDNAAITVNNADWLLDLNFIEFMQQIGSLFSVNRMLAAECYKKRMDTGLTFFELGYMLLQSYDFLHLHEKYGCKLQLGGNDQWSNIIGGVDLIRKVGHSDSFGLTFKLLTTKEGVKMGKTEKGALWLDPAKTSPYDFYQYWRNIADDDVRNVLSLLTFLPMEEIDRLSSLEDQEINEAKKIAAFEITKLIHGEEEALKASEASEALFGAGSNLDNMPTVELDTKDISILDAIVKVGIAPSKGQARTLITQGGISLNDEKIDDMNYMLSDKDFTEGHAILRKGKKVYFKLIEMSELEKFFKKT
ncbi:MAG: tyrosine--tRNA ligase [Oscillospiraceae bacterium]|nr:tyrosine--tRNA ligase [Oscillospiraceae bacterium]